MDKSDYMQNFSVQGKNCAP